jgi:catechol-2,3-dioxygenase
MNHPRLALLISLVLAGGAAHAQPAVSAVDAVAMTVADADRSIAFYRDVLGFTVTGDHELSGDAQEHV